MKASLALAIAILLTTPVLAGCLGLGGDEADEVIEPGAGAAEASPETGISIPAPTWTIGQWWTWESPQIGTYTYVVTGEQGGDWIVDTDNADTAFFDAQSDISFLGPVRKSDLAGSQGSDRVQFFQWPLADGATWTTRWDGLSLTITAAVPPEGPALLEGRRPDGSLHVAYTFDPQAGWFGEVAFHDENGTRRFGLTLSERGDSYVGDVLDWKLETLLDASGRGSMIDPARTVEVSAEATDLWTSYVLECPGGHGGYLISMRPVALEGHQQGYLANGACTDEVAFEGQAAVSPKDGPWSIAAVWGEGADSPVFEFLLLERTLVREAVAAA